MNLKCVAIDDEPLALALLRDYCRRMPVLQLAGTFDDALTGSEYLRQHPVDLLFIDINMPDISGLELVRSLPRRPMVIFTTAYKNFAFEGFELEAIDYLLKPIDFERFARAVNKAADYQLFKNTPRTFAPASMYVRSEYRMVKVDLSDILYIEGLEDYVKIHLLSARPVLTLSTLKAFLEKLPPDEFQRIHRSYIVPLKQVSSVVNKKVTLKNGATLPVSDTFLEAFQRRIQS